MRAKNANNLPQAGDITEDNSILISQGGRVVRMLMSKFREYIAYAAGADILGVPVPPSADVGRVPVVAADGNGFVFSTLDRSTLLWENPNPDRDFAAQTIANDNTKYTIFDVHAVKHKQSGEIFESEHFLVVKNGATYRLNMLNIYASGVRTNERGVKVDDNGFTFTGGAQYSIGLTSNSQASESDAYMVPIAIYGIR